MVRGIGWAVCGAGLIGLAGCGTAPEASQANRGDEPRTTPTRGATTEPVRAVDSLEAARLREDALALLEAAAVGRDPGLRANAIEGLSQVPRRARPMVRRGLQDLNEGVRTVSALVAGRARMGDLESALRARANDPSIYVRLAVLFALDRCGVAVDPTPVASALLAHEDPKVRAHAAFILGELGNPTALPMLRQAANESVPKGGAAEVAVLRQQVAEAMVKLGDPEPLQGLRAALYPSRPEQLELTALAVQILGTVRDEASIGQLIYLSATTDGDNFLPPEIRLAVAQALGRMGRTEGAFLADEYAGHPDAGVREQAAHVYGWTLPLGDVGRLSAMLEDPAPRVRVAAASAVLRVVLRPDAETRAAVVE